MHLQFVGSGDAFGSGGRLNTCFHVVADKANFLIDCGASSMIGLARLGIAPDAIDTVLITHFHGDHFGGIPFFILDAQFVRKRTRPLTIAGPPGIEDWYVRALEAAYEHSSKVRQAFEVRLVSLPERVATALGALAVTPYPVVHGNSGGPFYGYRIEVEGRVIACSGDTEWTDSLVEVARDADLFVLECYAYDKPIRNHLDLRTIERYLPRLTAKKIILTHMNADMLTHSGQTGHLTASDGLMVRL